MRYLKLHPWNVDYKKAAEIQKRLEKGIVLQCVLENIKYVAGADVSFFASKSYPFQYLSE